MVSYSDIQDFLSGNDIYSLLDNVGTEPIDRALATFHRAVIGSGIQRGLDPALSRTMLDSRDRLAGLWSVVVMGQMPEWAAFGPMTLGRADQMTNYDRARTFILRHSWRSPGQPAPGHFYPELLKFGVEDRVIALADSHVGCEPTSPRTANLHSLCARFSESVASSAAQPTGTTCALFLRAVLVGAGDGRFRRDPSRLGLSAPGRGDLAEGMGLPRNYGKAAELRTPGRQGGDPNRIRAGDLYYVSAASGEWQESGHVGLIVHAEPHGERINVVTIDGGQKRGKEVWAGGPGWYTTKRAGFVRKQTGGSGWVKQAINHNGIALSASIDVSRTVTDEETKTRKTETKKAERTLRNWVSMRDVLGGFQGVSTRLHGYDAVSA